ncbi:MAG: hypothetical protein WDA26_07010, partial [Pusillimonas sp.]
MTIALTSASLTTAPTSTDTVSPTVLGLIQALISHIHDLPWQDRAFTPYRCHPQTGCYMTR